MLLCVVNCSFKVHKILNKMEPTITKKEFHEEIVEFTALAVVAVVVVVAVVAVVVVAVVVAVIVVE